MTKATNGVWEVTVGPIDPGSYRYNFNVDGVSVIDPRNPATSESNANTWSLAHIPGAEFMDTREVPHAAVAQVTQKTNRHTTRRSTRFPLYRVEHGEPQPQNFAPRYVSA